MNIDKEFCLQRINEQYDYIAHNNWLFFTSQQDYDRYNLINKSATGVLNYFLDKLAQMDTVYKIKNTNQ